MELDLKILKIETNFKDVEKGTFRIVCKQDQETLKKLLEKIDQAIMENRDEDRFKLKDIKKRTLDTLFWEVTIERRYYQDSNDEFKTYDLKQAYKNVQKKYSRSEYEVLKATMIALKGPKSGQNWVKGLKKISDPLTNNPTI